MKRTEIRFNLKPMDDFKREIGDTYRARVGILGAHAARDDEGKDDINNPTLGLIQMYGSITNNIPPRDFLFTPLQRNAKQLLAALRTTMVKSAIARGEIKKVFLLLGAAAEKFVQQAFETSGFGAWPPNKPATIARKGSDRPLIDTGQLRRSIVSDVVKKGQI